MTNCTSTIYSHKTPNNSQDIASQQKQPPKKHHKLSAFMSALSYKTQKMLFTMLLGPKVKKASAPGPSQQSKVAATAPASSPHSKDDGPTFDTGQDIINYLRTIFAMLDAMEGSKVDVETFFRALKKIETLLNDPKNPLHLNDKSKAEIEGLLKKGSIYNADYNMSIFQYMAFQLAAKAYGKNGSWVDVVAELEYIKSIFGGTTSSNIGAIQEILDEVNHFMNKQSFIEKMRMFHLVDDHDKPVDDFNLILAGKLDTFMVNSNYSDWKKQAVKSLVNYFMDEFGYYDKKGKFHWFAPDLVFWLLITSLMCPYMNILQAQIGGSQETEDGLSKAEQALAKLMEQAQDEGTSWDQHPQDAVKWLKQLFEAINQLDDDWGRFKDVADRLKVSLGDILNDKTLTDAYNKNPPDADAIATELNKLSDPKDNTISKDLSSGTNVLDGQSSTLKGLMDQKTSTIKEITSSMSAILNQIEDLMKYYTSKAIPQ